MLQELPPIGGRASRMTFTELLATNPLATWFRICPCCGKRRLLESKLQVMIFDGEFDVMDTDSQTFLWHEPREFLSTWWKEIEYSVEAKRANKSSN